MKLETLSTQEVTAVVDFTTVDEQTMKVWSPLWREEWSNEWW